MTASIQVERIRNAAMTKNQQMGEQTPATKRARSIKVICAFGLAAILCASCTPIAVDIAKTATPIHQATARPAATATATPEVGIDMEKLHKIPPSIEYLENNFGKGEFIRSPDPISEPEAFDIWFRELLIPALGPVSEREVNYYTDGLSSNDENWSAENNMTATDNQIIGQPEFFYFQSSGVIFPVLVVNVSRFYPDVVDQTFCVAMYENFSGRTIFGRGSLELFQQESTNVTGIYLHKRPTFTSFPITDLPGSMIESMGGRWWDGDHRVNFALGLIAAYDHP
jgi:hypothetical protein